MGEQGGIGPATNSWSENLQQRQREQAALDGRVESPAAI